MRKIALFSVSAFFLVLLFLLYQFYLPAINYYQPINISLAGLSKEQTKPLTVYGITPLAKTTQLINHALTGNNNNIGLFKQVYISFPGSLLDSVSGLTVNNGEQTYVFNKTEIARFTDKSTSVIYLPAQTKNSQGKTVRLYALFYSLLHLQIVRSLSVPVLLLLLSLCAVILLKRYGPWLNDMPATHSETHIFIYCFCVITGVLYMTAFRFSDRVWLGGDCVAYQSIAVNMINGEGFPVEGGRVDSSAYHMYLDTIPSSETWETFYTYNNPPTLYRNPGYPIFIAAVYKAFSVNPKTLRIIQFLLLVMAGSLLPYISYRMAGVKGVVPGIFAYLLFLITDHHYAFDIMAEALIIVYIILLLLAQLVLKYKTKPLHAVLFGLLIGFGPLLKNYFIPLFLFFVAWLLYSSFITKSISRKQGLTIIVSSLLFIVPWSLYANYQIQKLDPEQGIVFITTQGEDVLLSSNNEYAADGEWHNEWQGDPQSFYNRSGTDSTAGIVRVLGFYSHHPEMILRIFPAKLIKGFTVTNAQLLFYITVLLWLAGNIFSSFIKIRYTGILLFLILFSLTLSVLFSYTGLFNIVQWRVTVSAHYYLLYCGLLLLCASAYLKYWLSLPVCSRKKQLFSFALIANFLLLTVVFYGSARIDGVPDLIFLLLAMQMQFSLLYLNGQMASSHQAHTAVSA